MKRHLLPAALLIMSLGLGYWIRVLEREISTLEAQLAETSPPQADAPATAAAQGDGAAHAVAAPKPDAGDPVAALEQELTALRADVRSLEQATAETASVEELQSAVGEDRILEVVKREQERLRDKHLSYQHERWMGWRKDALDAFADQHGLDDAQKGQLLGLLEHEADGLVELAKQPWFAEDPRRTVQAWRAQLELTDQKVREMLDGDALEAWRHDRLIERALLWPWLLEDSSELQNQASASGQ
ncbi:MAG: hypothetical protein PVI30_18255 [Myxococcales bacterium]